MAITGRQLQGQHVDEYRSSTISDDVGKRQGYLLGSALNSFGVYRLTGSPGQAPIIFAPARC